MLTQLYKKHEVTQQINGFFTAAQDPEPRGNTTRQPGVCGQSSRCPWEATPFPLPLPAGTCLPSLHPAMCLHCFLLPAPSPHHTFTRSLSRQLPLFFARPQVSGCICPGLPIGSETCHLANELPPFLCKRGPPAQCKKSFPGSGLFRQSCPGRCDNVQAVLRNM